MELQKKVHNGTEYWIWGEDPKLLIFGGVHGDERETSELLREHLEVHYAEYPSFLYIPFVSPSAVRLGTRCNERGIDLNRAFFDDPAEPEAQTILDILSGRIFDCAIDMHEDWDRAQEMYLYDWNGRLSDEELARFQSWFAEAGFTPYTGYDDVDDPACNTMIENGYYASEVHEGVDFGYLSAHLLRVGIIPRLFMPEFPMHASRDTKRKALEKIFPGLVTLAHA